MTCGFPDCNCCLEDNGRHVCKSDFCRKCGASFPPRRGEGICVNWAVCRTQQNCRCDKASGRPPKAPEMARGAFCLGGLGWGSCLCLKTPLWTFTEGCLHTKVS